jgi:hypothetical protein
MTIHRLISFSSATMLLLLPAIAPAQTTTYSGDAAAVRADVLGLINASISDTGQLPASGGSLSASLLDLELRPTLSVDLLSSSTQGSNNTVNSKASVANVSVNVAGIYITASVLTSNATAFCSTSTATDSGSSVIADLRVNGLSVRVTGAPNQTIPLIVGSLVINEQISSVNVGNGTNSANMLVNALHLRVLGIADVAISSSQAGMTCSGGAGLGGGVSPD